MFIANMSIKMYWPMLPALKLIEELVDLADILPTLLQLVAKQPGIRQFRAPHSGLQMHKAQRWYHLTPLNTHSRLKAHARRHGNLRDGEAQ